MNWKKTDLHIHTKATKSDNFFEFNMEKLKEYISSMELDIIGITNHNIFDKEQFEKICLENETNCVILPGIEIDYEKGHLLCLSDNIDDIENISKNLESRGISCDNDLKSVDLKDIFKDVEKNKLLLIPHFDKKPSLNLDKVKEIEELTGIKIKVGEVSSTNKWKVKYKKDGEIYPVCFSDYRMAEDLNFGISKYTYIKIEGSIGISSIKVALSSKNNITLSKDYEDSFELTPAGVIASNKLNVVIGKRSSGKSFLLNQIFEGVQKESYYIRQFELINTQKDFENKQKDLIKIKFKEKVKKLIELIQELEKYETNKINFDNYISNLKTYSEEINQRDSYAKIKLFDEKTFDDLNISEFEKFYKNINELICSKYLDKYLLEYKENIIEAYEKIKLDYKKQLIDSKILEESNKIINKIRGMLSQNSKNTQLSDDKFVEEFKRIHYIKLIEDEINNLIKKSIIEEKELFGYKRISKLKKRTIQNGVSNKLLFQELKGIREDKGKILTLIKRNIDAKDIVDYILDFDVKVYNDKGTIISGGEQTDYILASHLERAENFDYILIDEPESSFDNIFLSENLVKRVQKLSETKTIFLSTHNNTLGVTIKPDNYIFTEYDSGYKLSSYHATNLKEMKELINLMEAGEEAYTIRKEIYESINN